MKSAEEGAKPATQGDLAAAQERCWQAEAELTTLRGQVRQAAQDLGPTAPGTSFLMVPDRTRLVGEVERWITHLGAETS